jgi:anti-anti-sigma factor
VRTMDLGARPEATLVVSSDELPFSVNVSRNGRHRVVEITGELDVASRNVVQRACMAGRRKAVVVEMADMTFMDCCGYGGLLAARRVLQSHGGSLTLRNQTGQPAELLDMLELLDVR